MAASGADQSGAPPAGRQEPVAAPLTAAPKGKSNIAVYQLLFLNYALFILDHYRLVPAISNLYLYHAKPKWFQFLTSAFCHHSWAHIRSNSFFLLIFGNIVEEDEGAFGLWLSYLVCGLGAAISSYLLLPASTVSMGASGAVYGLFVVSVLVKLSWNWKNLLSVGVLGQFVIEQVWKEAVAVTGLAGYVVGGVHVNHLAHLAGALTGAILIFLVSRLPDDPMDGQRPRSPAK